MLFQKWIPMQLFLRRLDSYIALPVRSPDMHTGPWHTEHIANQPRAPEGGMLITQGHGRLTLRATFFAFVASRVREQKQRQVLSEHKPRIKRWLNEPSPADYLEVLPEDVNLSHWHGIWVFQMYLGVSNWLDHWPKSHPPTHWNHGGVGRTINYTQIQITRQHQIPPTHVVIFLRCSYLSKHGFLCEWNANLFYVE